MEKHEFALHVDALSSLVSGKSAHDAIHFSDEKLLHRMKYVLRLKPQDHCLLFDRHIYLSVVICAFVGKKQISVKIQELHKTVALQPTITFLLPVLKRDDYESALYALAELGINEIQLIFTHKTAHQWSGARDSERAEKILIAAAEQSKNFGYPQLSAPINLESALEKHGAADMKIFFDPAGKPLLEVATTLNSINSKKIILLVGPEGDLSVQEKELVKANEFIFCALTPTIVRAVQAVTLGAGFIRSM
jgi:RsmE family RNA methyltransferase